MHKGKFTLDQLVANTNALESLNGEDIQIALGRHITGDWGDIDHPKDWEANCSALEHGEGRLFSVYHDRKGVKFWIITEADRSATTVLHEQETALTQEAATIQSDSTSARQIAHQVETCRSFRNCCRCSGSAPRCRCQHPRSATFP